MSRSAEMEGYSRATLLQLEQSRVTEWRPDPQFPGYEFRLIPSGVVRRPIFSGPIPGAPR